MCDSRVNLLQTKWKIKQTIFFQFFSLKILKQFFLNLQGATSDRNLRFSYIFIDFFVEWVVIMKIHSLLGIDIRNVFSVDKTYYTIYVLHLVRNSGVRPDSYLEQNWFTLYSVNQGRRQNLLTTACNFLSLLFTEEHLAFLCLAQIIRMHCRGMRSLLRLNCAPLLSFFCPSTQQNETRSKEKTRKLGKNFKETFILMSPS